MHTIVLYSDVSGRALAEAHCSSEQLAELQKTYTVERMDELLWAMYDDEISVDTFTWMEDAALAALHHEQYFHSSIPPQFPK